MEFVTIIISPRHKEFFIQAIEDCCLKCYETGKTVIDGDIFIEYTVEYKAVFEIFILGQSYANNRRR